MHSFFGINWQTTFTPSQPILETILRGTILYLVLFTMLRVVLKRQSGTVGITDLLVVVLLGDAAQNAMAGNYTSITDGIILLATIVFWAYALDWLGYHAPWMRRFLEAPPLPLVKDGQLLRRNMRKELITEDELMAQVRQQGLESLDEVKAAYMESDGHISVLQREPQHHAKNERRAS